MRDGVTGIPVTGSGPAPSTRHLWGIVLSGGEAAGGEAATLHIAGVGGRARPPARARGRVELLARTLDRATRLIPPAQLVAVLARDDALALERAVGRTPEVRRVLQPRYRGSAVEVFLPLLHIVRDDPHATVVVLPSAQHVDHEARFMHYVARAAWAVGRRPDLPVLLGAHPRGAEAGHAWIEPGPRVEGLEDLSIRAVRRFVGRATALEARALLEGQGLLSTLVLVARARTLVQLGARHLPEVLESFEPLAEVFGEPEEPLLREAVYEGMPYASIADELLARGEPLAVLPIPDVMWSEGPAPVPVELLAS